MNKFCFVVIFSLALLRASDSFGLPTQGVAREVIDGDTFRAQIGGKTFLVRLLCIDAPEKLVNPKLLKDVERSGLTEKELLEAGRQSTLFLRSILKTGDTINLEYGPEKFDRFGRVLAYVTIRDGIFLNRLLVSKGYAGVVCFPPNDKYGELLLEEGYRAKTQSRGLWGETLRLPLFLKRIKTKYYRSQ